MPARLACPSWSGRHVGHWALTIRVQADRDGLIVQGCRGKHIDPSLRPREPGKAGRAMVWPPKVTVWSAATTRW